jgi:hypothetical protein
MDIGKAIIKSQMSEKEELPKQDLEKAEQPQSLEVKNANLLAAMSQKAGVEIPADKMYILEGFMNASKYGHQAALPMKCDGPKCSIIDICPLHQIGANLPEGRSCPVEASLVQQWVDGYVRALDIDPTDDEQAVDMHMVYEAAGLELLRMRTAHHLSKDPDVVTEKIVGYSPTNKPIYDDKPSQALLILERQAKIMNKLRESMLATRRSQAQVGHMAGDISVKTANVMAKARELAERRRKGGSIQDADYKVMDKKETDE